MAAVVTQAEFAKWLCDPTLVNQLVNHYRHRSDKGVL